MDSFFSFAMLALVIKCNGVFAEETGKCICTSSFNI